MTRNKMAVSTLVGVLVIVMAGGYAIASTNSVRDRSDRDTNIPTWIDDQGDVIVDKVPDFVPVAGDEDDIIGYIPREFLYPEDFASKEELDGGAPGRLPSIFTDPMPVYADDFRTLIGHMYDEVGFVPLGTEPGSRVAVDVEREDPDQ